MLELLLFGLFAFQQRPNADGINREQLQRGISVARQRAGVVASILDAVRENDQTKLRSLKVLGVKYTSDFDASPRERNDAPFSAASLEQFNECKPSRPGGSGINWVSVQWNCGPQRGKGNAMTAFRFDGMRVIEIRTGPGAPLLRLQ
ncbi:hypothetical protein [Sphingomonas sp. Root241]|uniref:hypothetical protein n=1 Tax=Sphingomonas sp. Root241 TaxID=1736501 RepID=UPI0006FE5D81|nr:hypothetical protein [Sphingomonas sp. Root241]